MDLIAIDVTGIPAKVGSPATIIGRDGNDAITATELVNRIDTTHYEIITRTNPLIERLLY
jgi:alanine racemase